MLDSFFFLQHFFNLLENITIPLLEPIKQVEYTKYYLRFDYSNYCLISSF